MKVTTRTLPPQPPRLHSLKNLTDQELALIRLAMARFNDPEWFNDVQANITGAAITRFLEKTRLPVTSYIPVEGMFK